MKKEIIQKIEIPEGVDVDIGDKTITVKGEKGENQRTFKIRKINFEKEGNSVIISNKKSTKREKKIINTMTAHIKNMIKGVQDNFEYKLKVCSSHFPITVEIQGKEATVKNFLGEKIPRKVKIPEGVDVNIQGDIITINSVNKESAGQAAANFERATKISNRDRRVFQDGIFITNKAGKDI